MSTLCSSIICINEILCIIFFIQVAQFNDVKNMAFSLTKEQDLPSLLKRNFNHQLQCEMVGPFSTGDQLFINLMLPILKSYHTFSDTCWASAKYISWLSVGNAVHRPLRRKVISQVSVPTDPIVSSKVNTWEPKSNQLIKASKICIKKSSLSLVKWTNRIF